MASIVAQYDEIVKSHPEKTKDAICFLVKELAYRNCKFDQQIMPTFIKPVFLSQQEVERIITVIRHVMNILEKVAKLYFTHPELRDYYYLDGKAAELMEVDQGYARNIVIARPDAFLVNGALRFVEFNCDSPAGAGYCDVEEEIFYETYPIEQISEQYSFDFKKRSEHLLSSLLEAYAEFAGGHRKPNIAIVDWSDVKTKNEFVILQSLFRQKGYDTVIADPRELKYFSGKLEHKGFPIDLVYRRVIFRELIEKIDEVQDFLNAYRDGKVCVANSLRSRLASNKAILSIMTNQRQFKDLFTEEENHIIQKHIPWTRRFRDIKTHHENNEIFLKTHVINHKDSLVLKPADSYGGKNVTIGCEADQESWENLVEQIISRKEDWVVQKYVQISQMDVPVFENDRIVMKTKKYNLNPFIFGGEYAGCLARLSDQSVINVSAGGGMVPVMCYAPIRKNHKNDDN